MTMSDTDDVINFLETWQSTLQEAAIAGCIFTDSHQVNLLLAALPPSWNSFITTQGGITDLTFTTLISNILQQNDLNDTITPKQDKNTTNAFYVKGKFTKSPLYKSNKRSQKPNFSKPINKSNSNCNLSENTIICHYCGIPGHKAPDCRKKKRDLGHQTGSSSRTYTNNFTQKDPRYLFSATVTTPGQSLFWFLDSGASHHMTPNRSLFCDFQELSPIRNIILGDNNSHQASGFGSVVIELHTGQQLQFSTGQQLQFSDVLYVPGLTKNLLSVAQITTSGNTIFIFKKDQCIIKTTPPNSRIPITYYVPKENNLYNLGLGIPPTHFNNTAIVSQNMEADTLKWHKRLGHIHIQSLKIMQSNSMVDGLPK